MTKWMRAACVGLLIGGGTILLTGCAGVIYPAGPGGVAYYDYDYYPAWNIYFYPRGHIYYWNEGGRWYSGRDLPRHYNLYREHHEHLRLQSRQPWTGRQEEHGRSADHHENRGNRGHGRDRNHY